MGIVLPYWKPRVDGPVNGEGTGSGLEIRGSSVRGGQNATYWRARVKQVELNVSAKGC